MCVCVCVCACVPSTTAQAGLYTRSVFKRSLIIFYSEFPFSLTGCHTKFKEPSLSYNFVQGRRIWFVLLSRVLLPDKNAYRSSRVLIRVAVSISYSDNHYSTGMHVRVCVCVYVRFLEWVSRNQLRWFIRDFSVDPILSKSFGQFIGLGGFYGLSTIFGDLMANPHYIYIYIYI